MTEYEIGIFEKDAKCSVDILKFIEIELVKILIILNESLVLINLDAGN